MYGVRRPIANIATVTAFIKLVRTPVNAKYIREKVFDRIFYLLYSIKRQGFEKALDGILYCSTVFFLLSSKEKAYSSLKNTTKVREIEKKNDQRNVTCCVIPRCVFPFVFQKWAFFPSQTVKYVQGYILKWMPSRKSTQRSFFFALVRGIWEFSL